MNFLDKIDLFKYTVVEKGAYVKILTGLKNTVTIAVIGLLIGIVIGTLIAVVKVIPKHGPVSKALDKICTVYVAYFRGTPIVV